MTDTAIYISVTRGNETLILDGNLCLLRELLTALNDLEWNTTQTCLRPDLTTCNNVKQEGSHVSG